MENTSLQVKGIESLKNKSLIGQLKVMQDSKLEYTKSNWKLASAMWNVVQGELFKDDFKSLTEFYKFVGMSKSNATELVKAYGFMNKHMLIPTNKQGKPAFAEISGTVGVAYELSKLSEEDYKSFEKWFISGHADDTIWNYSKPDVVELIKEWRNSLLTDKEKAEAEKAEAEAEANKPSRYTIKDKETAEAAIKEISEKYGLSTRIIKNATDALTAIVDMVIQYGITVQDIEYEVAKRAMPLPTKEEPPKKEEKPAKGNKKENNKKEGEQA